MTKRLPIEFVIILLCCSSCAFNFELTSQRTALENQILGTYKELDEDLVMVASVSASEGIRSDVNGTLDNPKASYQKAKLNREFNSLDIADLKDEQILGETWDGRLVVLPKGIGLVEYATPAQLRLAEIVTSEENLDRQVIWQRSLKESNELSDEDIDEVKRIFVKSIQASAKPGHWFLSEAEVWGQKKADVHED